MNFWEALVDASMECELDVPSSSSNITLQDLVRLGRRGQDIIADKSNCIDRLYTFSSVVSQIDYVPGEHFIRPLMCEYIQGSNNYELIPVDLIQFRKFQSNGFQNGIPDMITMFENKVKIYPPPSSAAGTCSFTGTVTATANAITGIVSTANIPKNGRGIFESEVVSWTDKTDTSVTGVDRGLEGTTAVAHNGSVTPITITERDIWVWGSARYKTRQLNIWNTGTCVFTNASANVTGVGTSFLANVFPGDYIGTGTNPSKFYQVSSVTSDTDLVLTSTYGETTVNPTTSYVASSPIDIPQESAELLVLYLIYRIKKKLELEPSASNYEKEFNDKVLRLRNDMVYENRGGYPAIDFGDM